MILYGSDTIPGHVPMYQCKGLRQGQLNKTARRKMSILYRPPAPPAPKREGIEPYDYIRREKTSKKVDRAAASDREQTSMKMVTVKFGDPRKSGWA